MSALKAELVARCTDEQTHLHRVRLESLYDHDREITSGTFFRHVELEEVSRMLGYAYRREPGLHIMKDWHISYYRSEWRGVQCYHLEWSGIDHIFVRQEHQDAMNDRAFFD